LVIAMSHSTSGALITVFFLLALAFGAMMASAHRRRGYAGGDLAVQRLHRFGGGAGRLCARQLGDDHRRHHRRFVGYAC
jgi:hypothetical protein